ncbi:MAG TPA: flagellar hook-length control protein FliK [Allosphingosinicella sp.]|nr:flagellar hook-length control protein FliK [Allosphingosinicella sp.]
MFTVIVTGLEEGHIGGPVVPGGGVLTPQPGEAKIEPQPGESDPNGDVTASVAQLLALVAGGRAAPPPRPGKTKDEAATTEKPQAKAETEIALGQPVAPGIVTIVPAIPVAAAPAAFVEAPKAAAQSPAMAAAPAPLPSGAAQPLLASTATEAPASLAPSMQPALPVAAPPFAGPIPAAVSPGSAPQASSLLSLLAGTAAVAPQANPEPAAAAPATVAAAVIPAASVAVPSPAVAAMPDAQAAIRPAASPQPPSIPSGAAPVIAPAVLIDAKSDTAAAAEPALPTTPATNATAATASPAPQPASQPAPAVLQALPAAFAGKEAAKPVSIERSRPASSPSPAAPLATAAPRLIDAQILGSSAPAPAADMRPANADAAAAPVQGLVIERQLDLAHQQDWIDQVARDIAGMAGGEGKILNFRLSPEHLGNLQVEIVQSHHGAAVRFSTDSEAARTMIADAQPRLVAEARAQGVRIAEAHVDLSGSGSGDPRRQPTAAPETAPIRTARSLQEDRTDDGKPSPNRRDLYA